MPRLTLLVAASFTSMRSGAMVCARFARSTKIFGSPTYQRTAKATTPGMRPTRNMPRQPIDGSSSGVTSAAHSTPACQPSAT